MATHDYVIANGSGAAVRADLNDALSAIVTQNSNATAPTTTYAYQTWFDTFTSPATIKQRDGSNASWITTGYADGTIDLGTVSTPSIRFNGDTNTGIYSPGADQVAISTGGTQRATVDASGRFGIGTASPGVPLAVAKDGTTGPTGITGTTTTASFANTAANRGISINYDDANVTGGIYSLGSSSQLCFYTPSAATYAERMRISNGGDILLGTTGVPQGTSIYGAGFESASNNRMVLKTATSVTTSTSLVAFYNPNGLVGTISVSGSATAYNTSSDYRLKENITPLTDAAVRVQQLKPSRFNFIADPDTEVDGFIAHEVQEIVPEAITGTKDEVDEDGKPLYQGIDQSKLVPLLTAALQEALGKIADLETRLAALEAN